MEDDSHSGDLPELSQQLGLYLVGAFEHEDISADEATRAACQTIHSFAAGHGLDIRAVEEGACELINFLRQRHAANHLDRAYLAKLLATMKNYPRKISVAQALEEISKCAMVQDQSHVPAALLALCLAIDFSQHTDPIETVIARFRRQMAQAAPLAHIATGLWSS